MPGRKILMLLFVITMFFDGGLITKYLVVRDLGMLDTVWAVVLPGAVGVWNLIIARSFSGVRFLSPSRPTSSDGLWPGPG